MIARHCPVGETLCARGVLDLVDVFFHHLLPFYVIVTYSYAESTAAPGAPEPLSCLDLFAAVGDAAPVGVVFVWCSCFGGCE